MITVTCGSCGKKLSVPPRMVGRNGKCPGCGVVIPIVDPDAPADDGLDLSDLADGPSVPSNGVKLAPVASIATTAPGRIPAAYPTTAPDPPSRKRYKVLTQKDKWFSGKFDPEKLEGAINAYADQGWEVKAAMTASIPGFGGNRDEMIIIMER